MSEMVDDLYLVAATDTLKISQPNDGRRSIPDGLLIGSCLIIVLLAASISATQPVFTAVLIIGLPFVAFMLFSMSGLRTGRNARQLMVEKWDWRVRGERIARVVEII